MFIRMLGISIILLSCHASIAYSAEADNECPMDNSAIGKPTIFSSKDFLKSEWNDKEKVAIFLTDKKETLTVKYSACENFGVDAELSVDVSLAEVLKQDSIADRIKWLTKKVIGKSEELKFIENFVKGKLFNQFFTNQLYNKNEMVFDIPSKKYSEAVMRVEIVKGKLLISLSTVSPG